MLRHSHVAIVAWFAFRVGGAIEPDFSIPFFLHCLDLEQLAGDNMTPEFKASKDWRLVCTSNSVCAEGSLGKHLRIGDSVRSNKNARFGEGFTADGNIKTLLFLVYGH